MKFKKYLNEKFTYKTEKDKTGHMHNLTVDVDGNGKTTSTEGKYKDHIHKIFEWSIQPSNGHMHSINLKKK